MKSIAQRTQIYLPRDLREEIDRYRYQTGESLAEYLRKAAQDRLRQERKKRVDLKKLADEFVGAAKGTKTDKEIEEWVKDIREDRRLSDERMLKRWEEARNSTTKVSLRRAKELHEFILGSGIK